MQCDGCHEEWESEFFCDKCSGPELTEVVRPVAFWDYLGPDTEIAEEYVFRSICLNCCPGHHDDDDAAF